VAHLLIVSHTPRATGFGKVATGIANALASCHAVQVLGLGPALPSEVWIGLASEPLDIGCSSALRAATRGRSTDLVLLVGVNVLSAWQAARLRADGYRGVLLAYVPVEGPIVDSRRLQGLAACDQVVAYHAVGAAALATALAMQRVGWIYHAIRHTLPTPPAGTKAQLKRQLLPEAAAHFDRNWVLNANRNDVRKCPEASLRAFATARPGLPDTTLVMHCNPMRPGVNLLAECDRLGIRKDVLFTRALRPGSWSESDLAGLYACSSIGISSVLGEGWGLVPFEHALLGGAQIMPAHAGLTEIWGAAPAWVPLGAAAPMDHVSSGFQVNQAALSEALRQLGRSPDAVARNAADCQAQAKQVQFSWSAVGAQWRALVARHLGSTRQIANLMPTTTIKEASTYAAC
jgi:D-inositol-3-phosphate glycosyltransferase